MKIILSDLEDVLDIREEDVMKVGSQDGCNMYYYVIRELGVDETRYEEMNLHQYFTEEIFNSLVRDQPKYVSYTQRENLDPRRCIRQNSILKSVKFPNSDEEVPLIFQEEPVTLSKPIPQGSHLPSVCYAGKVPAELEIETIQLAHDTREMELILHYRKYPETLSSKRRLRHFKVYSVLALGLSGPAFLTLMSSLEKSFRYPGSI